MRSLIGLPGNGDWPSVGTAHAPSLTPLHGACAAENCADTESRAAAGSSVRKRMYQGLHLIGYVRTDGVDDLCGLSFVTEDLTVRKTLIKFSFCSL